MKETKIRFYDYKEDFLLESGAILPGIRIAYNTYGCLNEEADNCIWVCHALTANSDVADWWPGTVTEHGFLDPEKYFVVCANVIGSCYGSTGPTTINPSTGHPWFGSFPSITIRDMVNAHILLAEHIGVSQIASIIGSSVGGFQAVEWLAMEPWRFKSAVLIATDAYASPWTVAADEAQRMAILSDPSYGENRKDAAKDGLAAARAIGMLTYRGPSGFNLSQQDVPEVSPFVPRRAATYQRHQGSKLANRFDAYSYITILNAFDTHDVGRGRGGIGNALKNVLLPVLVVGISTDIIFTPEETKTLASWFDNSSYAEIESDFGHDGFLVESEILNVLIKDFFKNKGI